MEPPLELKVPEPVVEPSSMPTEVGVETTTPSDEKEEEEDDEEEEEDKIVEKSYNNRFHKRNKRFPTQIDGVDNTFIAIEPKSGKEVIWNERMLPEKKMERDNKFISVMKKLKKHAHPFLIRFLDAWITKNDTGPRKLVFITERLDEGTLKQFLCNSTTRSKLLWRRHIGQLLSVLIFLHHLGVTHGNLKKETIYYQSSGSVKVGPFMLEAFFSQKSPSSDIYALGVLALEIAAWTQAVETQASSEEERIQLMLDSLVDPQQRSFIEACFDPNPATRPRIKALLNNPAVSEVPTLRLLSAKILVNSTKSVPSEDTAAPVTAGSGATVAVAEVKQETPAGFAGLLQDYMSHLEDETVIVEVTFPTDQICKTRTWKDFRSNFTFTSKYLEDVKNGFYPFLGYRFGGGAAEQDEDEETSVVHAGTTATDVVTAVHQPPIATASSGLISNVPSSATSRKQSTGILSNPDPSNETPPRHLSVGTDPSEASKAEDSSDVSYINAGVPPVVVKSGPPELDADFRRRSLPNSLNDYISTAHQLKEYVQGMLAGAAGRTKSTASGGGGGGTSSFLPYTALLQQTATNAREKRVRQQSACACRPPEICPFSIAAHDINLSTGSSSQVTVELLTSKGRLSHMFHALNSPNTPNASIVSTLNQVGGVSFAAVMDGQTAPTDSAQDGLNSEEDEEDLSADDDDDDDDQNDSDDDEEEDGGVCSGGARGAEKGIEGPPQVVHVTAPNQPPSTAALFTHCQYSYIGAGRWQVYVQMWFLEERLKREAYLQVLDNEWHDYDRVADLFEASKCLSTGDKSILVRLLAMARHNMPLIEGELVFPCYAPECNNNIDAQELYSKLVTLHLHQQVQESLCRVASDGVSAVLPNQPAPADNTPPRHRKSQTEAKHPLAGCDGLAAVSDAVDSNPANVCQPLVGGGGGGGVPLPDAHAGASVLLPSGVLTTASDPCRSEGHHGTASVPLSQHDPGSCPHEREDKDATDQPGRVNCESYPAASVPPAMVASSTSVQTSSSNPSRAHNSQTQPPPLHDQAFVEMLDVGSLAPENATCAFCDRHDYLHRLDLPNYLTSPCYHCRESLAREAKISPEDLFDLHLQHNVPWPAYLQARFNIPPDGRALDDLIAYDCRWRGREPCTCLGDSSPMPPCVEFPWLYEQTATTSSRVEGVSAQPSATTTAASAPHSPPPPPPRTSLEPEAADPASPTPTPTADAKHGDDVAVAPPHPMPPEMTASRTHQHAPSAALPCASRHGRGTLGPPQFCNPIGCPKDAGHQPISIEHRHVFAQKSMSEQPAPVSDAQQL